MPCFRHKPKTAIDLNFLHNDADLLTTVALNAADARTAADARIAVDARITRDARFSTEHCPCGWPALHWPATLATLSAQSRPVKPAAAGQWQDKRDQVVFCLISELLQARAKWPGAKVGR